MYENFDVVAGFFHTCVLYVLMDDLDDDFFEYSEFSCRKSILFDP